MNGHINAQIIKQNNVPIFAVIPYNDYLKFIDKEPLQDSEVTIPHEVVKLATIGGLSLIRAWREHLGLSQQEVAQKMDISQATYAKMEYKNTQNRISTYKRIAKALGIEWEQISE